MNPKKQSVWQSFWRWYGRHYEINAIFTAALFLLQLIHLYWLTTDVVLRQLLGQSFFSPTPGWRYLLIAVDYTEIPALIGTSLLYMYDLQKKFSWKLVWFLFFLNTQWLHLFWITDEFVINRFSDQPATILPLWLAWIAIAIDYLELPVIVDTVRKAVTIIASGRLGDYLRTSGERYSWRGR